MIRLNDEFIPPRGPSHAATGIPGLVTLLKNGAPAERQRALNKLVEARAEVELTDCLRSSDAITVRLAASRCSLARNCSQLM